MISSEENANYWFVLGVILAREVVDVPSVETLKVRLDSTLRNLIKLEMSLLIAQELD